MPSAKATAKQVNAARKDYEKALSSLRTADKKNLINVADVLAVLVSDLHISKSTPVARAEKNWFDVQADYFSQLKHIMSLYDAPLIVAGDVFDKPNPDPETINFAISNLPECYAIPGQHDLPFHNVKDIKKSAYWTLCEAGNITPLDDTAFVVANSIGNLTLHGFPWGTKITPCKEENDGWIRLAVVHKYIWTKGYSDYNDAPRNARMDAYAECLKGYDAAVFGDNHKGFVRNLQGCVVYNNGCFIRRRASERDYIPTVGLLLDSGGISIHPLDTSDDEWATPEEIVAKAEVSEGLAGFVAELMDLGTNALDFSSVMHRTLHKHEVRKDVRIIIEEALADYK